MLRCGMANIVTAYLNPYRSFSGPPPASGSGASAEKLSDAEIRARTARDTVEISEEGRSIINLQRSEELAKALPDADKDREAFDLALKKALEDVERIGTLFSEVLYSLHNSPLPASGSGAAEAQGAENDRAVSVLSQVADLAKQFREGDLDGDSFVSRLGKALKEVNESTSLFADIVNSRRA